MQELSRKTFRYKIDNVEHCLICPNIGIVRQYKKDLKECEAGKKDELDAMIDMLEKCGLPKKVTETLEIHHIEKIIGDISGEKKK
jgi:hypothetical protein